MVSLRRHHARFIGSERDDQAKYRLWKVTKIFTQHNGVQQQFFMLWCLLFFSHICHHSPLIYLKHCSRAMLMSYRPDQLGHLSASDERYMRQRPLVMWSAVCSAPKSQLDSPQHSMFAQNLPTPIRSLFSRVQFHCHYRSLQLSSKDCLKLEISRNNHPSILKIHQEIIREFCLLEMQWTLICVILNCIVEINVVT